MAIFYYIVPVGDGFHYVGNTFKYGDCLLSKTELIDDKELVFSSKEEAQFYIDNMLELEGEFEVEAGWCSDKFICKDCGSPLKVQCTVGADQSMSGYTERICSCCNRECLKDWEVITDENNNLIEIKRYYIG
jgi:RNase P subunit RPR2